MEKNLVHIFCKSYEKGYVSEDFKNTLFSSYDIGSELNLKLCQKIKAKSLIFS